ncbi:MFS transporter [Bifidobacterium aquikefiri]|uniref:MFS transporter n=1 Tax=Bifidobacterium aquikefiri TaxID=1653207 RepID=UPI0039E9FD53
MSTQTRSIPAHSDAATLDSPEMRPTITQALGAQAVVDDAGPAVQMVAVSPSNDDSTSSPLSTRDFWRYLIGFFVFNTLIYAGFTMVTGVLMPQKLKDLGIVDYSSALGTINAVGAVLSMFINVFLGALSDRTRSRFGKRTPWIVVGALLTGLGFFIISLPATWIGVGIAYCTSLIGLNMMVAPITAVLSDRIPEERRATISAAFGGGAVVGQSIGNMVAAAFLTTVLLGFGVAAVLLILSGILAVLAFPREQSSKNLKHERESLVQVIVRSFTPPIAGASDFWKAFICRTGLIIAYQMVTSYQLYILEDYIGASKATTAAAISLMSIITMIVSLIASATSGPITDFIGRRKPSICLAGVLYAIGIAMPWIMPSELGMYLFAGLAGFGYGMYMAVDQAINVDVLPNKKSAGKDLGFLNIATCAGQALGASFTSLIVVQLGGYFWVFPTAIVMTVISVISALSIRRMR